MRVGRLVLAGLLIVPLLELAIAIEVGRWIGAPLTIGLLLVESLLGAWIIRREGSAAWRELTAAVQSGRAPTRELADTALIVLGGALLLTPGFLTDIVGFLLVIPLTRPVARRLLGGLVARIAARQLAQGSRAESSRPGPVITGEVIDDPPDPNLPR